MVVMPISRARWKAQATLGKRSRSALMPERHEAPLMP